MSRLPAASPVSFEANVARLPHKGMPVVIEADDAQRARLAADHGLLSVESWRAELLVEPWKRNGVKVSGEVEADITQQCVVTLEPVEAQDQRSGFGPLFLRRIPSSAGLASMRPAKFISTRRARTARKPSPATRSMSARWPRNFSGWPSTLSAQRGRLARRRRRAGRRRNPRTFARKAEFAEAEILKTPVVRSSIAVVWRRKTAIFAPLPQAPLAREKVRQFPRDSDFH